MEYHYSIEKDRNGAWKVVMFMSDVMNNIDSPDQAQKIADLLNEAYQEGQKFAEDRITSKLTHFLLSK